MESVSLVNNTVCLEQPSGSDDAKSMNKQLGPGPCRKLLPENKEGFMNVITDKSAMSCSVLSLLETAVNLLYKEKYLACLDLCETVLDKIWEELNTGYWKDVHLCWRQAYSLVSVAKALSEGALLSEPGRNIDHAVILRTCDMGLLMGAPILGNVLAKMSREFQQAFGILGQWRRLSDSKDGVSQRGEKNEQLDASSGHKRFANVSKRQIIENGQEKGGFPAEIEDVETFYQNSPGESCSFIAKKIRLSLESQSFNKLNKKSGTAQISQPPKCFRTDPDKIDTSEKQTNDRCMMSADSPVIPLPPKVSTQKTSKIPRCSCPSVEMFQAMFMDVGHPVVITDAIGYWPALTTRQWNLNYLRSVAGCRTVPVEIGTRYTEESWTQKLMTIGQMIDQYVTNPQADKAYLAQHQLFDQVWELRDDISVPVYCCLGEDEDVDINAWFGPAGTISPLHQDPKHNFLCQVMGKKYVRLYSEDHTECVYPHPTRLLHNTSQIDLDAPDLKQYPKFKDIPCLETVLGPGEMLYIPPKHWHYVKSLAISFSVSFWWQ
ncbi:lysine-specific demethylase 8 [Plakobranchus ocellatus]|uniref:JmjC domain-containing protein 5 n=1 Tax=Plakobranchus ocellatus TaxID=259542 RepID=A0AAV4BWZ6_9GAST|nr:lysine-specific demethylase 8 [Plakobranchus ocellatus]